MKTFLLLFGAGMGVVSAVFWFWSAFARVTWEASVAKRKKRAARKGTTPNLGGVALDGNDLIATMRRQSSISGAAAALSGLAVLARQLRRFGLEGAWSVKSVKSVIRHYRQNALTNCIPCLLSQSVREKRGHNRESLTSLTTLIGGAAGVTPPNRMPIAHFAG